MSSIALFVLAVIIAIVYYAVKVQETDGDISTKAIRQEQVKEFVLRIGQVLALISGLGLFSNFSFLGDLANVFNYVSGEMDAMWEHGAAIVTFLIGLWAQFKVSKPDATDRLDGAEVKAKGLSSKRL